MVIQFRIQERKFSSNIIEKGTTNEHGKVQWIPYLAPLCKKDEGDLLCEYLINNNLL